MEQIAEHIVGRRGRARRIGLGRKLAVRGVRVARAAVGQQPVLGVVRRIDGPGRVRIRRAVVVGVVAVMRCEGAVFRHVREPSGRVVRVSPHVSRRADGLGLLRDAPEKVPLHRLGVERVAAVARDVTR